MNSQLAVRIVETVQKILAKNDPNLLEEFQKAHDKLANEYRARPADHADLLVLFGYLEMYHGHLERQLTQLKEELASMRRNSGSRY
ncbi:MAG: hypothetical protein AB1646_12800 [Thermodesulfobacteriota bacterium]